MADCTAAVAVPPHPAIALDAAPMLTATPRITTAGETPSWAAIASTWAATAAGP